MRSIEEILAEAQRDREIRCPYCGELQPNDDYQYPCTYWGEDAPIEWECCECEKKFFVKEWVERTYEVGKAIDKYGSVTKE